jgi:hypothetical protein
MLKHFGVIIESVLSQIFDSTVGIHGWISTFLTSKLDYTLSY